MDKRQYYLQKIAEEAIEVATAALKCVNFGNESWNPSDPKSPTNVEHLVAELHDLQGSIIAAYREGHIPSLARDNTLHLKKADKIDRYLKICQEIGTVT